MIYHVVAMAGNRVIGKDNRLPWHFSSDLKHFKKLTTGQTVLMGRKTYESLGKPLPNRENFVVSRSIPPSRHCEPRRGEAISGGDCFVGLQPPRNAGPFYFPSIDEALKNVKTNHCFIIGGAKVFEQTLNLVDGIYLTRIDADYEGDVYYPEVPKVFREKSREKLQDEPVIEVIFYAKDF